MDSQILLTGATGFLGSHLLEALIKTNLVIILKRSFSDVRRIAHLDNNKFISYDIDKESIERIFAVNNIRTVIHMAVNYGKKYTSKSQIIYDNVVFPMRLIETAASSKKVDIFINTDTFLNSGILKYEYFLDYILSKKQFVEWLSCFSHGIKIINLKLQHIYGTRDSDDKFIPEIINQLLLNSKEIKLTKGGQERDFIYIDDVVNAYIKVLESTGNLTNYYEEFDVGTGKKYTIRELMMMAKNLTENILKTKLRTRLNFGALPYRKGEMMDIKENISKLKKLGWIPEVSLSDGLTKTIKYYSEKQAVNTFYGYEKSR